MAAYELESRLDTAKAEPTLEIENADQSLEHHDRSRSLWHSIRAHPCIIGYTLGLCTAILLFGYDNVIVSSVAAMPAFQVDFGEYHDFELILPSSWLGVWTAASPIGLVFGALLGGWVQNLGGRKRSLLLGNFVVAAGIAICFVANRVEELTARRSVYLIGKLVEGLGLGIVVCSTQTWISEVAPVAVRAFLLSLIPTFTLLGQLVGSGVVFILLSAPADQGYTIGFASQWPFSAILLIATLVMPESPTYLVRKGRDEAAHKAHESLYSKGKSAAATQELIETIRHERASNGDRTGSMRDCFVGVNRRRTWLVVFLFNVPQFFGITLLANASYFMQTIGMGASNSLMFLVVGIAIGLVANLLSIWTLASLRRRTLLIATLSVTTVFWVSVGVAGCFDSIVVPWYVAVCMMLIIFTCGCGAWPASVVVASETSSLQLRGYSQSLGWLSQGVVSGIFSIVLPYIFNRDGANLRGKTGFIFAVLSGFACFISWLCVPEMGGLTPQEIDEKFEALLSARQF
ncbi:hypothetical protein H9Q74_008110 [Fusarium xylarioides]|nr:hypothetical protein H9Q71_003973 [Fusarium xylarioides]KAG5821680.1 hypothetical protein H9Q74_008110 [Fusarium xylarioides]